MTSRVRKSAGVGGATAASPAASASASARPTASGATTPKSTAAGTVTSPNTTAVPSTPPSARRQAGVARGNGSSSSFASPIDLRVADTTSPFSTPFTSPATAASTVGRSGGIRSGTTSPQTNGSGAPMGYAPLASLRAVEVRLSEQQRALELEVQKGQAYALEMLSAKLSAQQAQDASSRTSQALAAARDELERSEASAKELRSELEEARQALADQTCALAEHRRQQADSALRSAESTAQLVTAQREQTAQQHAERVAAVTSRAELAEMQLAELRRAYEPLQTETRTLRARLAATESELTHHMDVAAVESDSDGLERRRLNSELLAAQQQAALLRRQVDDLQTILDSSRTNTSTADAAQEAARAQQTLAQVERAVRDAESRAAREADLVEGRHRAEISRLREEAAQAEQQLLTRITASNRAELDAASEVHARELASLRRRHEDDLAELHRAQAETIAATATTHTRALAASAAIAQTDRVAVASEAQRAREADAAEHAREIAKLRAEHARSLADAVATAAAQSEHSSSAAGAAATAAAASALKEAKFARLAEAVAHEETALRLRDAEERLLRAQDTARATALAHAKSMQQARDAVDAANAVASSTSTAATAVAAVSPSRQPSSSSKASPTKDRTPPSTQQLPPSPSAAASLAQRLFDSDDSGDDEDDGDAAERDTDAADSNSAEARAAAATAASIAATAALASAEYRVTELLGQNDELREELFTMQRSHDADQQGLSLDLTQAEEREEELREETEFLTKERQRLTDEIQLKDETMEAQLRSHQAEMKQQEEKVQRLQEQLHELQRQKQQQSQPTSPLRPFQVPPADASPVVVASPTANDKSSFDPSAYAQARFDAELVSQQSAHASRMHDLESQLRAMQEAAAVDAETIANLEEDVAAHVELGLVRKGDLTPSTTSSISNTPITSARVAPIIVNAIAATTLEVALKESRHECARLRDQLETSEQAARQLRARLGGLDAKNMGGVTDRTAKQHSTELTARDATISDLRMRLVEQEQLLAETQLEVEALQNRADHVRALKLVEATAYEQRALDAEHEVARLRESLEECQEEIAELLNQPRKETRPVADHDAPSKEEADLLRRRAAASESRVAELEAEVARLAPGPSSNLEVASDHNQPEVAALRSEVTRLETRVTDLGRDLEYALSQLEEQFEGREEALAVQSELAVELEDAKLQASRLRADLTSRDTELDDMWQQLREARAMAATQTNGSTPPPKDVDQELSAPFTPLKTAPTQDTSRPVSSKPDAADGATSALLASTQREVDRLSAELLTREAELNEVRSRSQPIPTVQTDSTTASSDLHAQLAHAQRECLDLTSQIGVSASRVAELESEVAGLTELLAQLRSETIGLHARAQQTDHAHAAEVRALHRRASQMVMPPQPTPSPSLGQQSVGDDDDSYTETTDSDRASKQRQQDDDEESELDVIREARDLALMELATVQEKLEQLERIHAQSLANPTTATSATQAEAKLAEETDLLREEYEDQLAHLRTAHETQVAQTHLDYETQSTEARARIVALEQEVKQLRDRAIDEQAAPLSNLNDDALAHDTIRTAAKDLPSTDIATLASQVSALTSDNHTLSASLAYVESQLLTAELALDKQRKQAPASDALLDAELRRSRDLEAALEDARSRSQRLGKEHEALASAYASLARAHAKLEARVSPLLATQAEWQREQAQLEATVRRGTGIVDAHVRGIDGLKDAVRRAPATPNSTPSPRLLARTPSKSPHRPSRTSTAERQRPSSHQSHASEGDDASELSLPRPPASSSFVPFSMPALANSTDRDSSDEPSDEED